MNDFAAMKLKALDNPRGKRRVLKAYKPMAPHK
jgi:hypothetical protein